MAKYVYKVLGAVAHKQEDGTLIWKPVVVDPENEPIVRPKDCTGWFVTSPHNEYMFIPVGSTVRLEVIE